MNCSKISFVSVFLLIAFSTSGVTGDGLKDEFKHTRVIGYSQVGQKGGGWFVVGGVFESIVDGNTWELLWTGGAGVDRWRDPDFEGWAKEPVSAVPGESSPDRVLLSVSGPYGDDVEAWEQAIEDTIGTIEAKYGSVLRIILQPVVGGPDGGICENAGPRGSVRASFQHKYIVEAIRRVVVSNELRKVSVVEGFIPTVRSCSDYRDGLGHLTEEGAEDVARRIAEFYF